MRLSRQSRKAALPPKAGAKSTSGRAEFLTLHLTAFVCGGAVLILEILGTRLLSPYFGSNLYVWSALISITLLALALGYWLGGRLADARGTAALLDRVITAGALLTAITPFVVGITVAATSSVNFQTGILIAALVCFGPALTVLGMVGPIVIRLTASDLGHVGRSVGSVYATSTAGSIAGALAAGFLLLPNLAVTRVVYLTAFLLAGLAAFRWAARRFSLGAGAIAGLAVCAACWLAVVPADGQTHTAGGFDVVAHRPSFYGSVQVVDYLNRRYLLLDGVPQTVQTKTQRDPLLNYVWATSLLPQFRPDGKTLLLIGLGGGDVVRMFNAYGVRTTAIEIDPVIAEVATSHFGLDSSPFTLVIGDGRRELTRLESPFDFVLLDAYAGGNPPIHLFSSEAFAEVKRKLRPEGVFAINLITRGHDDALLGSVGATLRSVFRNVFAVAMQADPAALGNVVVFGSDGTLALPETWNPAPFSRSHAEFLNGLRSRILPAASLNGRPVRDDMNFLDVQSAPIDISVRAAARAVIPIGVLQR